MAMSMPTSGSANCRVLTDKSEGELKNVILSAKLSYLVTFVVRTQQYMHWVRYGKQFASERDS